MKKKNKSEEEEVITQESKEQEVEEQSTAAVEEVDETTKLQEEIAGWKDKYLRLQAEFDNFRKRNIKERADIIKTASSNVIQVILPTLDDFERAIAANDSKDEDDLEAVKDGFKLIQGKLKTALETKGLKGMDPIGEDFNPDFHEAITQIDAGKKMTGKVVDQVERGYYLNDKILRFSKTVVGK